MVRAGMTYADLWHRTATTHVHRVALSFEGISMTYHDVDNGPCAPWRPFGHDRRLTRMPAAALPPLVCALVCALPPCLGLRALVCALCPTTQRPTAWYVAAPLGHPLHVRATTHSPPHVCPRLRPTGQCVRAPRHPSWRSVITPSQRACLMSVL